MTNNGATRYVYYDFLLIMYCICFPSFPFWASNVLLPLVSQNSTKNQLSAFTNRSLACQEKCRVATRKSRLEMFAMGEWPWPLEIEAFTILQRFRHITIFSNPPYARVYFRLMNKQTSLCSASYVRWQHDTARIRPPLLQECRTFPLPDNSPTDKSCRRTNPLPVVQYKSE